MSLPTTQLDRAASISSGSTTECAAIKKKASCCSPTREQRARARRVSKGQIERKRRARINRNLNELKSFLVQDGRHVFSDNNFNASSKLDKADVLELSVEYMRSALLTLGMERRNGDEALQTRNQTFFNGFLACTMQMIAMLDSDAELQELDAPTKQQVHAHLIKCLEDARRTVVGDETKPAEVNDKVSSNKLVSNATTPCHSRQSSSLDGSDCLNQQKCAVSHRQTDMISPASTVHTTNASSHISDSVCSPSPSLYFSLSSSTDVSMLSSTEAAPVQQPTGAACKAELLQSQQPPLQTGFPQQQPSSVFIDINQLLMLHQLQQVAASAAAAGGHIVWPLAQPSLQQQLPLVASSPQPVQMPSFSNNNWQTLLMAAQASGGLSLGNMENGGEPWRPW